LEVYNGLSHDGLAAYNIVLENPKISVIIAVTAIKLIYGAYKCRSVLWKAVSYANPFSWFGKKSTNEATSVGENTRNKSPM